VPHKSRALAIAAGLAVGGSLASTATASAWRFPMPFKCGLGETAGGGRARALPPPAPLAG
jgi:hypothetical protein